MTTATLVKVVRDPRSGAAHMPNEQVAIMTVIRNLERTLYKVRWQAGGDCLVFPEDVEEIRPAWDSAGRPQLSVGSGGSGRCPQQILQKD